MKGSSIRRSRRRRQTSSGRLLHRTVYDQVSAYLFHICSNHPFVDGNKRTAFAAMDTFLRLNGLRLTLSDSKAYELTTSIATGDVAKRRPFFDGKPNGFESGQQSGARTALKASARELSASAADRHTNLP
jgi:hypothetical protein